MSAGTSPVVKLTAMQKRQFQLIWQETVNSPASPARNHACIHTHKRTDKQMSFEIYATKNDIMIRGVV